MNLSKEVMPIAVSGQIIDPVVISASEACGDLAAELANILMRKLQ